MIHKELRIAYGKTRSIYIRFAIDHESKSVFIRGFRIDKIKDGKCTKSDEYKIFHTQKEWEEIETVGFLPEIPTFRGM